MYNYFFPGRGGDGIEEAGKMAAREAPIIPPERIYTRI
jgi:Pyruvate/2-oxoacid:ferredoxin oxidoreductase gamma subunit